MEELPVEITTNILSRLPFKSIGRSNCVSKQWNSIISHPKFLITQLSIPITPDILLFFSNHYSSWEGICYLEDNEDDEKEQPLLVQKMSPFKIYHHQFVPKSYFTRAVLLGNCNGFVTLFDCSTYYGSNLPKNPIFIANPITGERAPLPHFETPGVDFTDDPGDYNNFVSGFVYQESKKEFKLVLAMFIATDSVHNKYRNEVQICTLGNGSTTWWKRKIGIVPDVLKKCNDGVSPAFVNECLHWAIQSLSGKYHLDLVSFNLDEEIFDFVPLPGKHFMNWPYESYDLGVLDQKLAVVKCFLPIFSVEIWVMNNYNVKESWMKKYAIVDDLFSRKVDSYAWKLVELVKFRKNGEILLLYGRKYLICYNTKSKKCSSVEVEGVTADEGVTVTASQAFVGRLISLKSAFGLECDSFEESILADEFNS